jgi:hypothetical protein
MKMLNESNSMTEIRNIRNCIYETIKEMQPQERLEYLKEKGKKAKALYESRKPIKV